MTKQGTAPLTKGAVVETWHDDGRGGGPVFGLVTAAGPRRFSVTWESGIRQRRPQGCHHVALVPETRRDLARLALVKAALLPQAIMEEICAEHTAAAGARCIVGDDGCCASCGVEMSTCTRCGGVGYHCAGCADSDAREDRATEE